MIKSWRLAAILTIPPGQAVFIMMNSHRGHRERARYCTDQLLGKNLDFLGRHIARNRATINCYTIDAHAVMQHGSVRQVAQVRHIDALRPPTVVYAYHGLIALL